MELVLNLAWFLLAIVMVIAWLRQAPRQAPSRRVQIVALSVLLMILLPAISMTDDLMAAQNPAEIDCCLRRDHSYSRAHVVFPVVPALPARALAAAPLRSLPLAAPRIVPEPVFDSPFLIRIQNRPPPAV